MSKKYNKQFVPSFQVEQYGRWKREQTTELRQCFNISNKVQ